MVDPSPSPYAPPQAELEDSEDLEDSETWSYPLRFCGTLGFNPRLELRDAQRRLLWRSELKPIQRGIPLETLRGEEHLRLEARLESAWRQRWVFRDLETGQEVGALSRLGGCLPGAFTLWPVWLGEGGAAALQLRARGPAFGRWVARLQPQPPLARTGHQDPDGLGVHERAALQREASLTVHASAGAPAFLRVRREPGALRRNCVIERLEGEVGEGVERLAHQVLFLVLGVGLG